MIKLLNQLDLDAALAIAISKDRIAGTKIIDCLSDSIEPYFLGDGIRYAVGYFEENKLISWVAFGLHENKTRGKFWYVSYLFSSKQTNILRFDKPETGGLIDFMFDFAESLGYFEYYFTVSKRVQNVYDRQWKTNTYRPLGRYQTIDLCTIPANSQPDVDLYWRLMGCETKPDDMIIKKRVLCPESRSSINTSL